MPLKRFLVREFRPIALLVVVVALAHEEEVGRQRGFALGGVGAHGPAGVRRRPRGIRHPVVVANVTLDVVLRHDFVEVGHDLRCRRDRLSMPWLEVVAVGVEVAVGTDTGEAEQVPGTALGVATLEDHESLVRACVLEVAGCPESGDAGADDDEVVVVRLRHRVARSDGRRRIVAKCALYRSMAVGINMACVENHAKG